MKITDYKRSASIINGVAQRDDKKAVSNTGQFGFGDTLRKTEEADIQSRLNQIMSEIEKQGDILAKNMDLKALRDYKRMITAFMDEVVNGSLKFSKHSHFDRRGRHKIYAIIKKVNSKIDELGQEILKEEKDNIKILESMGSIKGMLLDMYM